MKKYTKTAPKANAERLIKIPAKSPKQKNPKSFTKNANRYSKSENTILASLKLEYIRH